MIIIKRHAKHIKGDRGVMTSLNEVELQSQY